MIGIRKALDLVFTRRELKILDDIMPEMTKRQNADDLHQLDAEVGLCRKLLPCFGGRGGANSKNDKPAINSSKINIRNGSLTQANEKESEAQSTLLKK